MNPRVYGRGGGRKTLRQLGARLRRSKKQITIAPGGRVGPGTSGAL
jgi:hypothetical protein